MSTPGRNRPMGSPMTDQKPERRLFRAADGESRRWRLYAGGAVAVLAIVLAVVVATNTTGERAKTVSTGRGPSAGSFEMMDGRTASFEKYRGQPLVVNFFASWCTPCLAEMPGFERVHQELETRVAFLGVNLQDSPEAGRRVVEQTGVTYDIARDPTGALFQSLGAIAMPTTVLIDANGEVVERISGEISARDLRARIDKALLS